MQNNLQPGLDLSEALRRKHEARAPHLRYAVIIAVSVVGLLLLSLAGGGILLRTFSKNRPLRDMSALGVVVAPDLKSLERFPAPNLEVDDDHAQMSGLRAQQNQKLNSYGWVDRSRGRVRIPIERAMDLLAQRGLPARTEGISPTGASALQLIQERSARP